MSFLWPSPNVFTFPVIILYYHLLTSLNLLVSSQLSLSNTSFRDVNHPSFTSSPHLQYEQEKEVGVGYFLELLKQVDGQESDDVVLGCHNAVTLDEEKAEKHRELYELSQYFSWIVSKSPYSGTCTVQEKTLLPHTETFRCILCHWLWPFSPPLQKHKTRNEPQNVDITTKIYRKHPNRCISLCQSA